MSKSPVANVGIGEAPDDGQQYARQSLAWALIEASGGGGMTTEVFTASDTWNVPAEVSSITCLVVGAGGGGAGFRDAVYGGGGGGGGQVAFQIPLSVTPSGTVSIVVGAGGTSPGGGFNDGNDGGVSSVTDDTTGLLVRAYGGLGGDGKTAGGTKNSGIITSVPDGSPFLDSTDGKGGSASSNDGDDAYGYTGGAKTSGSGGGGACFGGNGGNGGSPGASPPANSGAGGGGGIAPSSGGGTGGSGYVQISYF
jgi:hypothetical protein